MESSFGLLILGITGALLTWTITVAGLATWLAKRFRDVEKLVYREQNLTREEMSRQFWALHTRVYRLEMHAFGVTFAGEELPRPKPPPLGEQL